MPHFIKKVGMTILMAFLVEIAGYASHSAPSIAQQDNNYRPRCKGNPSTGPVTCTYFTGANYVGGWANGRPSGRGIFVLPNEGGYDRYEGQWRNGRLNGPGVYLGADDTRIEGVFREGFITSGKVFYPNGDRFEGRIGILVIVDEQGKLTDEVSFRPRGQGKFFFANGSRFEGEYVSGSIFGRGVFTHADGTRCEAQFYSDTLDGKGTCRYPNKDRYEGELRGAVPHGRGVMIKANGQRYQGEFRDGQPFDPKKPK